VRHTKDENQIWWRAFSEERTDALLKPVACCAPRSSIHKADAALAVAADPPQQRILVFAVEIKTPGGNASQFLELIGSVVVAVPTDYTRSI
jgi:hypothetical protein